MFVRLNNVRISCLSCLHQESSKYDGTGSRKQGKNVRTIKES